MQEPTKIDGWNLQATCRNFRTNRTIFSFFLYTTHWIVSHQGSSFREISAYSNRPHYKLYKHTRFWSNCEIKMPQIVVFGLYRGEIKMPPNPNLSKDPAKVLLLENFLHQINLSWPYDSFENLRSVALNIHTFSKSSSILYLVTISRILLINS